MYDIKNLLTPDEDATLRTLRNTPVIGRIAYDRFMHGGKKSEYARRRMDILDSVAEGDTDHSRIREFNRYATKYDLDRITSTSVKNAKNREKRKEKEKKKK